MVTLLVLANEIAQKKFQTLLLQRSEFFLDHQTSG